jgi:hypothetical protein
MSKDVNLREAVRTRERTDMIATPFTYGAYSIVSGKPSGNLAPQLYDQLGLTFPGWDKIKIRKGDEPEEAGRAE